MNSCINKKNDYILDPFCGSGTAGVVALKNIRNFVGIELVEKYQQMAQKRIA
jgi:site-specific DNA-methyltransferase (adenine-specific)